MIIGFGNNVVSSLAADITATQTTIQVMPGAGALFAGLLTYDYANDSNLLKTYAKITLTDAKETVFEVCHLTEVNNDMLTIVRGQEGTAAKGWSLNDVIANFATRGSENQFVQIEQLQSGHYTSAVAGGTANGLTLALPATYFLNGSTDWALKTPLLIYPTLNNTGASTLQLTMGGRVMGTYPLVKGSNTALRAGDIVAKSPFLTLFNAEQERFTLLNPTTNVGAVLTVNSHAPDAAGNVKLGTAADADIGTQAGNVIGVGDFGLAPSLSSLSGVDLNTLNTFGFYVVRDAVNTPLNDSSVWFLSIEVWDSKSAGDPFRIVQIAEGYGTSGTLKNRTFHRTYSGNAAGWSTWVEFYSEAHKPSASDVGLGNVGNFMSVQQGGATGMLANKVYLGWSSNKGLIGHVDSTPLGSIYCEEHKPTATEVGAYPITGGNLQGGINALGSVGTQGGAFLIRNADGVQVASVSAGNDGAITVYSDVKGRSFGFDGFGNFTTAAGGFVCELGQRVYSPNNPPPVASQAVTGVRLSGRTVIPDTGGRIDLPPGCVYTGMSGANYDPGTWGAYSAIQVLINGQWATVGTV
ncbi:pyocin knob domain-containing protein [Serratia sp. IR-2025]